MADPTPPDNAPKALPRRRLIVCALLLVTLVLPLILGTQARNVPAFGQFVGRFHLALLHFPLVLLGLALCLEIFRQPLFNWFLPEASPAVVSFILGLGAVGAWAAAICGWILALNGGYEPALLQSHFYSGLATAACALLALLLNLWGTVRSHWLCRLTYVLALPAASLLAVFTGHMGGSITHGDGFLTEHAPAPLRRLLGLPANAPATSAPAASAPFYQVAIQPLLTARCVACHGPEKAKGKLRLDSFAELLKGGNTGPALSPGKPDESELLRRIRLPLDDDDRMPPKGKPQLTAEEEAVLAWWIGAGGSGTATAAALSPPPSVQAYLQRAR